MKVYWDIWLPRTLEIAMLRHAYSQDDREVCGLLAGLFLDDKKVIKVEEFKPIVNVAESPLALFRMDPYEQKKFFDRILNNNKHVIGCFHSHPHNFGIPSLVDQSGINENYAWMIWGGQDNRIRSWYPRDYKNPDMGFEAANLTVVPV
jgi:proteasome lid subunit RPN8/RPN11